MLSAHPITMHARWKAVGASTIGIESHASILGAFAAAGRGNFDVTVTASAAVAA